MQETAPCNNHRKQLRHLLQQPGVIQAPGIYDGLSALLVEQAGFPAAFVSGACLSFARLGRPDMGLVCAREACDTVFSIRDRIELPIIVDIDTGFGNALNVQRTVREFERAGASALQIEDQQAPKRCGHLAGKSVVATSEMVGKVKAALDARRDENTLIFARTDALGVLGLEAAMDRAEAYLEAGANALFIEAPPTVEAMQLIAGRFAARAPLIHNLVEGGNSPVDDCDSLQALGYRVALHPAALINLFTRQSQTMLAQLREQGTTRAWHSQMCDLHEVSATLGLQDLLQAGSQYGAEPD
ncbi:carboxyvinyl-carboxyphosphonate phosphorylmutase [Parahaliea maris]|uniref:Carboxyvinyl-carboxyphosphonate phosphorylmutase n=1 Tax=Parahaliea maris TaxID=2716870 RepID=A0A5C8ZU67_9GAMM|nr:isocitrate lyase/phosphoenolpyruvate mutase family protein [Parahaliea maris]TXS92038.1 carboxyvinyl-carboxyphosphonate phosphorylmutase [Parahaliea maris]